MLSEIQKSINSVLYERFASPFWGSLIAGWIISNWAILVVLFFSTYEELGEDRITFIRDYISENPLQMYLFPFIYALAFLTVGQLLATQSYRLFLYFKEKKRKHRNKYDEGQRFSIEDSRKLRQDMTELRDSYATIFKDKEQQIESLEGIRNTLQNDLNSSNEKVEELANSNKELNDKFKKLSKVKVTPDELSSLRYAFDAFEVQRKDNAGYIDILSNPQKSLDMTSRKRLDLVVSSAIQLSEAAKLVVEVREGPGSPGDTVKNLSDVFKGKWLNEYQLADGSRGEEEVEIKEGTKYYSNGRYKFNLDKITISPDLKKITFRKNGIAPDTRKVINEIKLVKPGKYEGIEEGEIKVTYTKLNK